MPAWRELTDPDEVADAIVDLFADKGERRYDEVVTQSQHAVQAAELAAADGASDELIVAALLHDLGHLIEGEREANRERDLHHEELAARFLAAWYPPAVFEPIRLHVAAKRYLCAVEPTYHDTLSPASVHSLSLQGGLMERDEVASFAALTHSDDATRLRRWDDLAKDPDRITTSVSDYRPLLVSTNQRSSTSQR